MRRKRPFHINVNRRVFEEGDGVRRTMTGTEIARMLNVHPDNAVLRRVVGSEWGDELPLDTSLRIRSGDEFIITRRIVEGGCFASVSEPSRREASQC